LAGVEQAYSPVRITRPLGLRDMLMVELFGDTNSLAVQIFSQISARFSVLTEAWLPAPVLHGMADLYRLTGLKAGKPGIFAICNVQVE